MLAICAHQPYVNTAYRVGSTGLGVQTDPELFGSLLSIFCVTSMGAVHVKVGKGKKMHLHSGATPLSESG